MSDVGNIDCTRTAGAVSGTCRDEYPHGTTVTLTAEAAAGSLFDAWTGACAGTSECTLDMTADRGVTASFELVPPSPVILPAVTQLHMEARVEGPNPPIQIVSIVNAGGGGELSDLYTGPITWTPFGFHGWLEPTFVNGATTTPTQLELRAKNTGELPQRDYTASFEIRAEGASPIPLVVNLRVNRGSAPHASDASARLKAPQGASQTVTIQISNGGGGGLSNLAAKVIAQGSPPWITAPATDPSLTPLVPSTTPTSVTISGQDDGSGNTRSARVLVFSRDNEALNVEISVFGVFNSGDELELIPGGLIFSIFEGDPAPTSQSVYVTNFGFSGDTVLNIDVDVRNAPRWLLPPQINQATQTVAISVDPTDLRPGTYTHMIDVTGDIGYTASRDLEIALIVRQNPVLRISADTVRFFARHGGAIPPSHSIRLENGGDGVLAQLVANVAYQGTESGWLSTSLSGQTAPVELGLGPNSTDLEPGSYAASVTITASNGEVRTISVEYLVGSP